MPPSARDRRALLSGGAVIAALLLYLLWPGSDPRPPVEPVQPDLQASMPVAPPPAIAFSAPPAVVTVPVAAAPGADVSQLRLVGIFSRGAVIGMADGTQRFVPVGREILPGVILRGVEVHHALLATGAGEVRLGFDGGAQPQAAIQASR